SKFHFTAQFDRGKVTPATRPEPPESLFGLRVLVVDDNETNRLILQEMLSNWEMQPAAVAGAEAALEALGLAREAGTPYRPAPTDVHMPDVDGFQLTQAIKARPELQSTVILMLTSGDSSGDISRCKEVGGAAYLMKPVKQSELFDAITTSLAVARQGEPADR